LIRDRRVADFDKRLSSACVVPSNLKFEKNSPVTPAELASKPFFRAKYYLPDPTPNNVPPPLKPGVKIVFVTSPDVELAEFLRAERASTNSTMARLSWEISNFTA